MWRSITILETTRIQKQFLLSVFVFIDSLVVSALQDSGVYAISRPNNLKLHLGCHTCWLSYFALVCLWCGQTVGCSVGRCTVTWLPNFLGWVDLLSYGAPQARSSAKKRVNLHVQGWFKLWRRYLKYTGSYNCINTGFTISLMHT